MAWPRAIQGNILAMAVMALPVLAGCVAPPAAVLPDPGLPPEPAPDACGASALQYLVGQDAEILTRLRLAGPARVIRPGMAVTMDYSAQRLNIELDAANRIQRVACG